MTSGSSVCHARLYEGPRSFSAAASSGAGVIPGSGGPIVTRGCSWLASDATVAASQLAAALADLARPHQRSACAGSEVPATNAFSACWEHELAKVEASARRSSARAASAARSNSAQSPRRTTDSCSEVSECAHALSHSKAVRDCAQALVTGMEQLESPFPFRPSAERRSRS